MLPAANRKTKETLRMFRDSGNYMEFFPEEDDIEKNDELLKQIPNLDTFGNKLGFWKEQIKTSLGNVLKVEKTLIILDEGHKAYSDGAQKTLRDFNPTMIVELSATPPERANNLVEIFGIELDREEMIKLDLHINNQSSPDWHDTLRASVAKTNGLEKVARQFEQNTNVYIRPINVIQVERTGREQRGGGYIHSEDAKDYLVKKLDVAPDEIAIKTSDKDELKEIDDIGGLLARDCKIRFVITKQALQEGWDCPFAYVLTVLANPHSKNALTQLVGRILRQPYAQKTKIKELDESYVFCFQQNANEILGKIRKGFSDEGLGDLKGQIVNDNGEELDEENKEKILEMQPQFKKFAKEIILPVFVINKKGNWSKINYDIDIVSRVDWTKANISKIYNLILFEMSENNTSQSFRLSENIKLLVEHETEGNLFANGFKLDIVFFTRQIIDIVPNPWIAFEIAQKAIDGLFGKHKEKVIEDNFVFIILELRKILLDEKDRLAKETFDNLIANDKVKFFVISKNGFKLPEKIKIKGSPLGSKNKYHGLQRSLFKFYPENDFNEMEKSIAWYLEDQKKLFFWYRNMPKRDYFVQGWKKQKVYPDFIFTKNVSDDAGYEKIFVVETKGTHLLGNTDTGYKNDLFNLCNKLAKQKSIEDLGLVFENK